jgi:hypothetical protein
LWRPRRSLRPVDRAALAGDRAPAPRQFTIGAIFSRTGPGGIYGPQQLNAARLAVRELNRAGGVDVRLVAVDDGSDPKPRCRRHARAPPARRRRGARADGAEGPFRRLALRQLTLGPAQQ